MNVFLLSNQNTFGHVVAIKSVWNECFSVVQSEDCLPCRINIHVESKVKINTSTHPACCPTECFVLQVTPRPRIPTFEQVDPQRPYYQCRHCTLASHSEAQMRDHAQTQHSADQRYICPRCDLAYCKNESGEFLHKFVQSIFFLIESLSWNTQANFDQRSKRTVTDSPSFRTLPPPKGRSDNTLNEQPKNYVNKSGESLHKASKISVTPSLSSPTPQKEDLATL